MAAFSEPHFDAYQAANFGNATVFDMVRPEMRHLVDPVSIIHSKYAIFDGCNHVEF